MPRNYPTRIESEQRVLNFLNQHGATNVKILQPASILWTNFDNQHHYTGQETYLDPIGFYQFKISELGYWLWVAAINRKWRGHILKQNSHLLPITVKHSKYLKVTTFIVSEG